MGTIPPFCRAFIATRTWFDKLGFSYGLNTVQYIVFGPLPRSYFPWKSEVFDSVPGVQWR